MLFYSCDPVYKASNYQELAHSHQTIAILPPKINIEIKSVTESEKIRSQENLESARFQKALYEYLTANHQKNNIYVSTQNPDETNRILAENGITSLRSQNYQALATLLNVDAVIISRVSLAQPLTNAEAFFTAILAGPGFGANSKVSTVDLALTDRKSGKMFWNYNWETGGTFTSSEKITNSLMKSAAYRFPYKSKTKK